MRDGPVNGQWNQTRTGTNDAAGGGLALLNHVPAAADVSRVRRPYDAQVASYAKDPHCIAMAEALAPHLPRERRRVRRFLPGEPGR